MTGATLGSAAALVLLAPVCAAYLAGADAATGHPLALAAGLLRLAPLLGGPALLIRELARREQLGWRGIAFLAAAFGVAYAGLIDQSLFSATYGGIPTWDGWRQTTAVPVFGVAPDLVLTFAGGIAMYGVTAPIALIEALSADPIAPWLDRRSLALVAVLSAAALVVAGTRLLHGTPDVSAAQAAATALAAGLLVLKAVRHRRQAGPSRHRLRRRWPPARAVSPPWSPSRSPPTPGSRRSSAPGSSPSQRGGSPTPRDPATGASNTPPRSPAARSPAARSWPSPMFR